MALFRDAVFKKFPSMQQVIDLEKKKLNLKSLNKLTVRFDPFGDGVSHIRKFNHCLHESDIVKTNLKCLIRTEILTDRSDPHVIFDLIDGQQFLFKCANLKFVEILQLMNKYITPLAPKEDLINEPIKVTQKRK